MKKNVLLGLFVLSISIPSLADHPAVEQRQSLFEKVEEGTENLEELIGDKKWSESAVLAETLQKQLKEMQGLFPEDSKGGGRGRSKIWENWQDFSTRLTRLEADYQEIYRAAIKSDRKRIEKALDDASSSCRSCHMKYRSLW